MTAIPLSVAILLAAVFGAPQPSAAADRTDSVTGMELLFVEGGEFMMGDYSDLGPPAERPPHPVAVTSFHMGRHEVTVGQYRLFADAGGYRTAAERAGEIVDIDPAMGAIVRRRGISWRNPGFPQEETDPVVWVNWHDAAAFTDWMAVRTGLPYRLPTEAEWEFAARERGQDLRWAGTSDARSLEEFAWYADNSGGHTRPVGGKRPNALGLYDMSGNVWEWCLGWEERYPDHGRLLRDPRGSVHDVRAIRGGSWRVRREAVTTTYRNGYKTGYAHSSIGFRVVLPQD